MTVKIDLDEIVPQDIEFVYRGDSFVIPGDIDVESTFELVGLFQKAQDAEASGDVDLLVEVNVEMEQALIRLFQQRQPDLERLPFGVLGYRHVLLTVLSQIGFQIVNDEPAVPPVPAPNREARRRRSSGSRK